MIGAYHPVREGGPLIENTSKRDPLLHLAGILAEGQDGYNTGMEAAGQRQVVHSDLVPTDMGWPRDRHTEADVQAEYEALGFVFGDVVDGDPLFRHATLPEGWCRAGTSHSMHSDIVDERGIRRASIFYKAASYDRRAHMDIVNVGGDLGQSFIWREDKPGYDSTEIPWDTLTADEIEQVKAAAVAYLKDVERHPDIYGDRAPRAQLVLDQTPKS